MSDADKNGKELTFIQCFPAKRCKPEEHDFPTDDRGEIDANSASCTKCGMSFLAHIHMEMP